MTRLSQPSTDPSKQPILSKRFLWAAKLIETLAGPLMVPQGNADGEGVACRTFLGWLSTAALLTGVTLTLGQNIDFTQEARERERERERGGCRGTVWRHFICSIWVLMQQPRSEKSLFAAILFNWERLTAFWEHRNSGKLAEFLWESSAWTKIFHLCHRSRKSAMIIVYLALVGKRF